MSEVIAGPQGPSELVSAVVPAYNAESHIEEAVKSILDQTYRPIECIVVDDSSTDRTAQVVRKFGASVSLLTQSRGGVSTARNLGVQHSSGAFVAFLDADDIWLPEKIEKQMAVMRTRREVGLVYTGLHVIDDQGAFIGRLEPPIPRVALRNTLILEGPGISVAQTGLLRSDVFHEIGGFDETMSTSADADFACRVATRYAVASLHEPLAMYRHHSGQMHLDPSITQKDMEALFEKMFRPGVLRPPLLRLERRARANLQVSLAGKYIRQRNLRRFWRHVAAAAWLDPLRLAAAAHRLATSGGPRDFRWM